jgi:hypothetical protein
MYLIRLSAVILVCVLGLTLFATATQNELGVADSSKLTFTEPTRVGDTLLPKGDYEVLHSMNGSQHIMTFRQLYTGHPAGVQVQCQLVPLSKKAERTQQVYVLNASNERVLQSLTFKGDLAQHVF